jgi:hypothetical protein
VAGQGGGPPPLHGGNPLHHSLHQHEVTPILILHDIHAN